jgi:hypothetical protein
MFIAIAIVISIGITALYISSLVIPFGTQGLGLEVFGVLISLVVFVLILLQMLKLGKHFGFKDDGNDKQETIIGRIWFPLSLIVAAACFYITARILV